ncbi:MAG TPA: metallophosphoesterase [Rubrobacter sp.]
MLELAENALVVFVSDSHIGGDPGCDGFESPAELEELFDELASREGQVELILAGDFFDFLQIGRVPEGEDRALLTVSRPEYEGMFAALKRFKAREGKRVVYIPGNHDAEGWWNPGIQETLRRLGLVDEFAYYYLASVEAGSKRRVIYCEHGNQLDEANTVEDYRDGLDTPLGHHVVMDFTRRIAPYGEISPGLDLAEIKMVYPLVAIPGWVASRYFYNFVGKVITFLLIPLVVIYMLYRLAIYFIALQQGLGLRLFGGYRELPEFHVIFVDMSFYALVILALFAIFFVVLRRALRHTLRKVSPQASHPHYSPAEDSVNKVKEILTGNRRPPMNPSLDPTTIDVFVSGHTHLPSLSELKRPNGRRSVLVNSGCFLRQLQPVSPHLKGPPVFVSKFVLTHVRVFAEGEDLRVELWEQPKPARQRLTRLESLLSWGRRPIQPPPDSKPRISASANL